MTFDGKVLIGFLSGSLVTLIIKNIFEFINKKIEFKRDIRKKFFEKKLEAADKAVANIYSMANSVGILSSSYEMMSDPKKNFSYEVFKAVVTETSNRITQLSDISMSGIYSIYLYTDLDSNPLWTVADDKVLLDAFSDLQAQDANLVNAFAAYDYSLKNDSPEKQQLIWQDIITLISMYQTKMKDVSNLFNRMKLALIEQRKMLRDEFKKFDI